MRPHGPHAMSRSEGQRMRAGDERVSRLVASAAASVAVRRGHAGANDPRPAHAEGLRPASRRPSCHRDRLCQRPRLRALRPRAAARGRSIRSRKLHRLRLPPATRGYPVALRLARSTQRCGHAFRRLFGLDDGRTRTIGLFTSREVLLAVGTIAPVQPLAAEIALIVRSDVQRQGLGATLMANVIRQARCSGFQLLSGYIDPANVPMRRLARQFGFETSDNSASRLEARLLIET